MPFLLIVLALCLPLRLLAADLPREIVLAPDLESLYHPDIYFLPNGMRVVANRRPDVNKVSIRVVVDVGTENFRCAQKELPHVIEHMLFEGTGRHSSSELEDLVASKGARWNAETGADSTVYSFEVYRPYLTFALDLLREILAESTMDPGAMERAIKSAQIESDNGSQLSGLWQTTGWGKSGSDRLFTEMGALCSPEVSPYQFDHDELLATYRRHYVPANMTVIIVGNFDDAPIKAHLNEGFGAMPGGRAPRIPRQEAWTPPRGARYESLGEIRFSNTAEVGVAWQTGGYTGNERFSLEVLAHFLETQLYNVLRNEHQLSYAPVVENPSWEQRGLFALVADTHRGNEDRVIALLRGEFDRIVAGGMDRATFDSTRQSLLISAAMVDMNVAAIANYYAESLFELDNGEGFENYEQRLLELDYETFTRTVHTFFAGREGAEYVDRAMFDTLTTLWIAVSCIGLVTGASLLRGKFRARSA